MAADGERLQGQIQDQSKILTQVEIEKLLTQFMRELVKESLRDSSKLEPALRSLE